MRTIASFDRVHIPAFAAISIAAPGTVSLGMR